MDDLAHSDASGGSMKQSRLSTLIFLLVCAVPAFAAVLFGAVDSITWVLLSIAWATLVVIWLADSWRAGSIRMTRGVLPLPLLGLLLIGLVQLLPLGGDGAAGVDVSRALSLDPYATRLFVLRLVIFVTFFAAALTFIDRERRLKRLTVFIVIFGGLMAFFGLLQRLANPEGIYGVRLTPQAIPFGPFVNQHHFASFMQMTGGLALGLLLGRDATRNARVMLATAVVVMGVAVVFTGSRGGMLGLLATIAFAFLLGIVARRRERDAESPAGGYSNRLLIAAGGIALVLVIFGTALLLGGNDSLLRGIGAVSADADVSTGRLHFWPIAVRIFLEHPIIGAGLDAFGAAFTRHDTWSGMFRVEQAHNDYLQILADAGILGFVCVAAFIFMLFRNGLKVVASTRGMRQAAAVGALAGCLGVMVHSFFDFPLRTNSNAFFFLLLAAIATVTVPAEVQRRRHRRRHS